MKGDAIRLADFMESSKKRFIIPVYQRNYDWKKEQCKQLYDDLVKVIKQKRRTHFFGSLVSVYQPSGKYQEYLIIDGQQRLTTVSLLLLAMHNLIAKGVIIPDDDTLQSQLYEDFLVDKHQPEEKRIKLKPVKNDNIAFSRLFSDTEEAIQDSNLTVNYEYFYNRIQKQEITIDELIDAIYRLHIINIELNSEDDPQLIFESLNSTGLDLSEGDKIRNFILMGLPAKLQEKYYNEYWNVIEEFTNYDVSSFIRDYLSVKLHDIPSEKRVYLKFKEFVGRNDLEIKDLLNDILAYAKRYKTLLHGGLKNKEFNASVDRLNRLETTVTRPFFLEVLRLMDEGVVTLDEVAEIFHFTESYIYRRMICHLPTNALNKIFVTIYHDIFNYDKTNDSFLAKFKYALLVKKENGRFPNNEEFAKEFQERSFYQMTSKNKIYTLERLENFGTKETHNVYAHIDEGEYSIEHIMPQHLTPEWIKALGDDYKIIHEQWLHRIANLTLTAYNSSYSNSPFEQKKNMEHGFVNSGIQLNKFIAERTQWTLKELEDRNEHLVQKALKIWDFPETSYQPEEKQLDSCTLDDDLNQLTGRQIAKFSYRGAEQPVESWQELYQKTIQILYEEDRSVLTHLAYSTETANGANSISTNEKAFKYSYKVAEGIYAWLGGNTVSKLSILLKLFNAYQIDPSELQFFLRDETEDLEEKNVARFVLRKKFWTFAIDAIQKAHENTGCFCNTNPSKDNWISGWFGVQGFNISCVANYNSARIDLYLGKSQKEKNKEAFDKLYVHKNEIENQLGVKLEWRRADDSKTSKISYSLTGVGLENENDWKLMANFLAEWSKKFYDQFVPILKGM